MDINTCIKKYLALSSTAFQAKRTQGNVLAKAKELWHADGAYRADGLESQIKSVAQEFANDENAKLLDVDLGQPCKM